MLQWGSGELQVYDLSAKILTEELDFSYGGRLLLVYEGVARFQSFGEFIYYDIAPDRIVSQEDLYAK